MHTEANLTSLIEVCTCRNSFALTEELWLHTYAHTKVQINLMSLKCTGSKISLNEMFSYPYHTENYFFNEKTTL